MSKIRNILSYLGKSPRKVVLFLILTAVTTIILTLGRISYTDKVAHRIDNIGANAMEMMHTKTSTFTEIYAYSLQKTADELMKYMHDNATKADYLTWLKDYHNHLIESSIFMGDINLYFANDTMFLDSVYGDISLIDSGYDYKSRSWYKEASRKPLAPVFSELYNDLITKRQMITISIALPENRGVIGLDIHTDNMNMGEFFTQNTLETKYNFLMDEFGNKIMFYNYNHEEQVSEKERAFIKSINEQILSTAQDEGTVYINDRFNHQYTVFFKKADFAKYYYVAIVDNNKIHSTTGDTYYPFIIILLVFLIFVVFAYMDSYYLKRKADDSVKLIEMLGDAYFRVYRVNLINNTYDLVRTNGDDSCSLATHGTYEYFYNSTMPVFEEKTREEFIKTLSVENLHKLGKHEYFNMDKYFHKVIEGVDKWVNVRVIRNKAVSKKYILLCFRNCDDEKEQELAHMELLEKTVETLKESTVRKRMLYSSVSHDMRTPLNCIIGMSELMAANMNDKEKLSDYLYKIKSSGSQLLSLINNFLEMAKYENSALDTSIKEFNLETKVNDICNIFTAVAEMNDKSFIVDYDVKHGHVRGDVNKLAHILTNLLSNAFKYTKDDGCIKCTINEVQLPGVSRYKFIVEDNGIGMSQEFLEKIFEPFKRESREDTRNIVGTGLGLSIVYSQIKHMGGDINVESVYGKGTKVTVTLPFERVKPSIYDIQHSDNMDDELDYLSEAHFLVAEDNMVNMEIITELLKLKNIKVTQASNGYEALEMFKRSDEWEFDMCIFDIQMPIMDGLESARSIRQLDRRDAQHIPIIALSSNAYAEDLEASKAAGMDAHLTKPINLPKLYETLTYLMKRKAMSKVV